MIDFDRNRPSTYERVLLSQVDGGVRLALDGVQRGVVIVPGIVTDEFGFDAVVGWAGLRDLPFVGDVILSATSTHLTIEQGKSKVKLVRVGEETAEDFGVPEPPPGLHYIEMPDTVKSIYGFGELALAGLYLYPDGFYACDATVNLWGHVPCDLGIESPMVVEQKAGTAAGMVVGLDQNRVYAVDDDGTVVQFRAVEQVKPSDKMMETLWHTDPVGTLKIRRDDLRAWAGYAIKVGRVGYLFLSYAPGDSVMRVSFTGDTASTGEEGAEMWTEADKPADIKGAFDPGRLMTALGGHPADVLIDFIAIPPHNHLAARFRSDGLQTLVGPTYFKE